MNTAQQAQRSVAVGSMHDMTALVAEGTCFRTPQGRRRLLAQQLIERLRSTFLYQMGR
jgi:hypothetical protein